MKRIVIAMLLLAGTVHAQTTNCAIPVGFDLPDLVVDRQALRQDRFLSEEFIDSNDCQFVEGCVETPGLRQLLRFTTMTPNIGRAALVIGDPSQCSLLYHFSECHGHYHLEQFADYRLWTVQGFQFWRVNRNYNVPASNTVNTILLEGLRESGDLISGRKQGFCLIDNFPFPRNTKRPFPNAFDDCIANQGLSVGWADLYVATLDCQYIDVTGAVPAKYILEVEVNPDHVLPESNYANNSTRINLRIPKPGKS